MVAPISTVSFTLNDEQVQLTNVSPHLTLLEWLRAQPGLTGTKKMCGEGGCGCCVVSVVRKDPATGKASTIAINSCLCPIYSVNGWIIKTVEGIGSSKKGFHPIQTAVAQYNGTQCGYCTPGFVMSMYSLLENQPHPSLEEVEDNFDGNICRCTGYRPILDAMKSFADESEYPTLVDIEDLGRKKCSSCSFKRSWTAAPRSDGDPVWYRPQELKTLFDLFRVSRDLKVKLVCGDTGRGVFKDTEKYNVYVDVKGIAEINDIKLSKAYLSIGAAIPLNSLIHLLTDNSQKSPTFAHLASHLKKIASNPVRNIGSWAGNLMLTHDNKNFPSDVYTIMEAVGATVTIATENGSGEYPLWDFLQQDMTNSILVSLNIPYVSANTWFRTYKTMPRSQNAHAYVNAAFCMEVDPNSKTVQSIPSFILGGIDEHAISATATESFMLGKDVTNADTLKGALEALSDEIEPNSPPVATSVAYRKSLVLSLFYKFYLAVLGSKVNPKFSSAAQPYVRPVSKGSQTFGTIPSEYPLTQAMPKLAAALQTSGEAQYTTDIPAHYGELSAAFVVTEMGNAKITGLDESAAMEIPGAIDFITAKNIPEHGQNNFEFVAGYEKEPVFATDTSEYAGQAVAMVIADTQEHANQMARAVKVQYKSLGKPILTIKEAIAAKSFFSLPAESSLNKVGNADDAISKSDHKISGEISCGTQYHFHLETQTAIAIPEENSYTVYSSTQWVQQVQFAVAGILGIANSKVNVSTRRVGGGFGGKISRAAHTAAACALGAYVTGRPVKMHMDLDTNMKSAGKRFPFYARYTVGATKEGVLNGIKLEIYDDSGCSFNDSSIFATLVSVDNVYKCPNWLITAKSCKTHTACNTYCRGPGFVPAIFIIESVMDHLAKSLQIDPEELKAMNMYKQGDVSYVADPKGMPLHYCNIKDMWKSINETADVAIRKSEIKEFNLANRWRKRGISLVPLRYGVMWVPFNTTVLVSVYTGDGTVSIAHGGVEIGQGINTKVAQVAAHVLGIGLNLIDIKPTNSLTNPNGMLTGSSITSELNCQAVLKACEILKARLNQVKADLNKNGKKDPTWLEIITRAYETGVDLSSKFFLNTSSQYTFNYNTYGVTCAEVEIDVLTGETEVLRVDILYDCGESMNPDIDVGQVEGAFVMGLGYWLTEKIVYDPVSGQLLTHNTWEYKPPSSKDIPQDMRISLLKDAPNPLGVLRSKAVGEPPLTMSNAVLFAVKRAIESARHDAGNDDVFLLSAPATVEDIQLLCQTDISQMLI